MHTLHVESRRQPVLHSDDYTVSSWAVMLWITLLIAEFVECLSL